MAHTNKIKLLILTPTLECGGSEKYVSMLCNNISTDTFDVSLVVLDNSDQFYAITNEAIKITDLHTPKARNAMFKLRRIVQQEKPQIIFSISNHLNVLLAMFRWMFAADIKFVARESSLVSSNIVHAKYPAVYKQLVKKFYKTFDRIICQSVSMQKDLIDNFNVKEEQTVVINNPIEAVGPFDPIAIGFAEDDRQEAPSGSLPMTGGRVSKFITVGRLSKEKGIDRLIKSVCALQVPYKYFIIGDGPERTALEQMVMDAGKTSSIIFTGKKEHPYAGMEDASLFLMGSHYEGFPNVLLEAGGLGIPVVAFDVPGGINEIIMPGMNGLLVKDDNINAFTLAMENALQMAFDRQKISSAILERFSMGKAIAALEALFTTL